MQLLLRPVAPNAEVLPSSRSSLQFDISVMVAITRIELNGRRILRIHRRRGAISCERSTQRVMRFGGVRPFPCATRSAVSLPCGHSLHHTRMFSSSEIPRRLIDKKVVKWFRPCLVLQHPRLAETLSL